MPLIIEDGTGVENADSYKSETDLIEFLGARGLELDDNNKAGGYLLRAMDYIESLEYRGVRTLSTQGLNFPRTKVLDLGGLEYASTFIPRALGRGQMWMAYYFSQGNDPGERLGPAIKQEKVDTLEVTYAVGDSARQSVSIEDFPNAYRELKHLLSGSGSETSNGVAIRA